MKKKIFKACLWFILIFFAGFILLNILASIFNLGLIIKDIQLGIKTTLNKNIVWTLLLSLMLGIAAGIFNYFEFTWKYWKEKFNFKDKNKQTNPLLIDQRDKNVSYSDFNKIIKPNSNASGVVVHWYKQNGKYVWYVLPEAHVRALGSTGAAKSQFFILANLYRNLNDENLEIRPNMVVVDPKGELYENSLKVNPKKYYDLIQLDFTNPKKSIKWNPLAIIWDLYQGDEDSKNLAIDKIEDFLKSIPALDETNSKDPNWPLGARNFLANGLKFMLEYSKVETTFTKDYFNLATLSKLTSDINKFKKIITWWAKKTEEDGVTKIYPEISNIRDDVAGIIDAADGPKSSYHSTAINAIKPYISSKTMWELLSKNEVDFKKFFDKRDKPIAFFITYPDDKPTIFPLVSLVITQAYQSAIEIARKNKRLGKGERLERSLQLFIDEFGILPKLANFENWINIARSRNIQIITAYQDQAQLDICYKTERKVIEAGFIATLLLATSDNETAKHFSEMIGQIEKEKESTTTSENKDSKSSSKSVSLQKDKIISSEEIIQLDKSKYILIMNNQKPSILNKSMFYKEMASEIKEQLIYRRNWEKPTENFIFNENEIVFNFNMLYEKEYLEAKEEKELQKQLEEAEREERRRERLARQLDKQKTKDNPTAGYQSSKFALKFNNQTNTNNDSSDDEEESE